MAKQRKLTESEITLARTAFGDWIKYAKVRLSDGPGLQPLAHAAFAKGNPAITVGSTVYFKRGYCRDFSAPGEDRVAFLHEMTHVWQYQRLGLAAFFARYGAEFAAVGGKPDRMYLYSSGDPFDGAMLEAQAEMVADYSAGAAKRAKAASSLARTGFYGL